MEPPLAQPEPEVTVRPKKHRNSYPKEARVLLEDWLAKNQSQMPSMNQRQDLCSRIKQIPGGEWCTPEGIYRWFHYKNKKLSISASAEDSDRDHRFPSLSKEALDNLGLLIKDNPVPPPEVLALWSGLLQKAYGATGKDVLSWVAYVHKLVREKSPNITVTNKLPTPQSTATPEPQPRTLDTQTNVQPIKLDPTQSPLLPGPSWLAPEPPSAVQNNEESISPSSPVSSTHFPIETPEPAVYPISEDYHPQRLALLSLIEAFAEDPSTTIAEEAVTSPPASTEAFAMICRMYDPKLTTLLRALDSDC